MKTEINNFYTIRLLLAAFVVAYHYVVLTQSSIDHRYLAVLADFAVKGFFVLSGYFVYKSRATSTSWLHFYKKRFLRVYPPYAGAIALCVVLAFLVDPVGWGKQEGVIPFVLSGLSLANFLHPTIGNTLAGNYLQEWNGALWTIKLEVGCYLLFPLILATRRIPPGLVWAIIGALGVAWVLFIPQLFPGALGQSLAHQVPAYFVYFTVGCFLSVMEKSYIDFSTSRFLFLAFFVYFVSSFIPTPYNAPFEAWGIGFLLVGYGRSKYFISTPGKYDYSYCIYLCHFPVIQFFIAKGWS